MDATKTQGLSIATRCESIDAFVASFGRYVVDQSIFIISKKPRERDQPTPFVFTLSNGTPALAGICVIRHMWLDDTNPFKQPGIWLEIKRLNAASVPVLERMQKAELSDTRAAQHAAAREKLAQDNELAKDWDPSTDSREPAMIADAVANVARAPGAKDVLPANPLSALDDDMLDVALELGLDERAGSFEESSDDAVYDEPAELMERRAEAKPMPKLVSGLDVTPAVKVPRHIMPLETEAMAPLEIEKAMAEAAAAAARAVTPPPQSVAIPSPRFVRDTESPPVGEAATEPLPAAEDSPEHRATEQMPPLAVAPSPAVKPASAVRERTEPVARISKSRVPLMIGIAVVVIAGAVVLWKVLGSSSTAADTATTPTVVKQVEPPPPAAVDAAPAAPVATTPDAAAVVETPPEPEPPPETGSAAADAPKLAVTSTPAGASVFVNGKRLGATPFVTALPAGKIITVAIAKPGYQTIVRKLTAAQAKTPLRVQLVKRCTGLNCL